MTVEQCGIECEQYIDSEEPCTITLVPSGSRANDEEHFLMVTESPFDYEVQMVTHKEFEEIVQCAKRIEKKERGD